MTDVCKDFPAKWRPLGEVAPQGGSLRSEHFFNRDRSCLYQGTVSSCIAGDGMMSAEKSASSGAVGGERLHGQKGGERQTANPRDGGDGPWILRPLCQPSIRSFVFSWGE